jgi:hypothetical protein
MQVCSQVNTLEEYTVINLDIYTGEWITGAVCMFIVDHLLSQYGHSERVHLYDIICDIISDN